MQAVHSAVHQIETAIKKAIPALITSTFGLFSLWLHHCWHGRDVEDSNVVLVLTAKKDHNGALSVPDFATTVKLHAQKGIKIIYRKVACTEDVTATIQEIKAKNNHIKGLWFNAHGSPQHITLGKRNENYSHYVSNSWPFRNARDLVPALEQLEPDARIIFQSCSTGHIDREGNSCIAQTFAQLAPKRMVFAPPEDINSPSFHFKWKKGEMVVKYTQPKRACCSGCLRKIANVFYEILFVFSSGHYGRNNTAIFKSYPP